MPHVILGNEVTPESRDPEQARITELLRLLISPLEKRLPHR